jgi:type VII secretion-associated protein (TIGR03931 family)
MTEVVVEVGPVTIVGPNHVEAKWVSAGFDGIDDELILIDDRVIAVTDVWRKVMREVVGGPVETTVLVCPTWWSSSRIELVTDAARTVANDVVVLRRAELLADRQMPVVELAPEFVVVWSRGVIVDVLQPNEFDTLLARIPTSQSAVVDAPEGVDGARPLIERLRANGIDAGIAPPDWVPRSVEALRLPDEADDHQDRRASKRSARATAVMAGTLLSAAALCGGLALRHNASPAGADMPMTLVVEGRVGVMVPAQWIVQRVSSGPGSARVQVVSLEDATVALHITQSSLASQQSHEQMAESLRGALGQEPEGIFVDFNPADRRVDRAVVTYREIRPDREIAWFVLIDQSLRIAVGCQSKPGHQEGLRQVCDRAIGSAHAVF